MTALNASDTERVTVERLYNCFAAHNGAGMTACYADDATFSDPVFTSLRGREVGGMWRMLTKSSDLDLTLDSVEPRGEHAWEARWTARYTFSATKRRVINIVTSNIRFAPDQPDKIKEQHDHFDFPAWQRQALGTIAVVLGWTGIPGNKIRATAAARLAAFLQKDA